MKLLKIGKVLKPHGYKGSFTVSTTTGKESALKSAIRLFIGADEGTAKPYQVVETAWMPKAWKITVQEVESEEAVEKMRDLNVFVERSDLPKTKSGEYYVSDLIGLTGIDSETQKSIGTFSELQELAISQSNIVQHTWIFKNSEGIELQVPAVPHFIGSVDLLNRRIFLKNLRELEDE